MQYNVHEEQKQNHRNYKNNIDVNLRDFMKTKHTQNK